MKAPANFTASATKKVNPLEEAINSNFAKNPSPNARESFLTNENQVQNEFSSSSDSEMSAQSQILNASKIPASEQGQQRQPLSAGMTLGANTIQAESAKTTSRREVKEKFLVSMSKGERSVFKAFCAMQNVSMNHFVMCAMDYFKEDLENGKVSLSAHSYKRKES